MTPVWAKIKVFPAMLSSIVNTCQMVQHTHKQTTLRRVKLYLLYRTCNEGIINHKYSNVLFACNNNL